MIDPVLRGPLFGAMLMAISSSLMGVMTFVKRRSLIGEAVSHAAYPGVVIGSFFLDILVLPGAFISALLGMGAIHFLETKSKIASDSALCMILASSLGIGVTIASYLQVANPMAYRRSLSYLYGQAATMTDVHILIYAILACISLFFVVINYRCLQVCCFDPQYGIILGLKTRLMDILTAILLTLSIVIGIRSVGVVLMAGMLVAPVVAARQWTHHLPYLFSISVGIGVFAAFTGTYFAQGLPTGPVILLIAAAFAFISLLKTWFVRFFRKLHFRWQCHLENGLKMVWKYGPTDLGLITSYRLVRLGYLTRRKGPLTLDGERKAAHIVRLHRLWEVYLTTYLGTDQTKVHRNAEEMEHILTPELEHMLTDLLNNPLKDPHHQPIPEKVR
ncbi:MAG: metal ABC transporter permease [Simkaniaceae bacterium]|nr:metal ABC transporter permease [Simkaniaceae bacterium]